MVIANKYCVFTMDQGLYVYNLYMNYHNEVGTNIVPIL